MTTATDRKESVLELLIIELNEVGKQYASYKNRLNSIGMRLLDDSSQIAETSQKEKPKEYPGYATSLKRTIDEFRELGNLIESDLAKLEKFI